MNFVWLRSTLVTTLCLLPAAAMAGGGGTSGAGGGGTDSGGGFIDPSGTSTTSPGATTVFPTDSGFETDSATDTGGTTDSGGMESSSSGEICGECTISEDPVLIVSPDDGATVGTLFEVRVTAPHTCFCDTCGCFAGDPLTVTLRVDGQTYDNCNGDGCSPADHTFTVMLEPGEHTLDAVADHEFTPEFSDPITVTVEGEAPSDSSGEPPPPPPPPPLPSDSSGAAGSSSTSTGSATDDSGGGCGCTTAPTSGGALGGLLALLGLISLRRRRQ